MAKQSFLLVSLREDKAKELANVISNDSCRKILDYLTKKEDATESEISKELEIAISTVHYNLKQLMRSEIINCEEFHYSKKGKEVNHYKLANKYIIIAPKTTYGIKEKLRMVLPASLLALIGAGFIHIYSRYFMPAGKIVKEAAQDAKWAAARGGGSLGEPLMEAAERPIVDGVFEKAAEEGARGIIEKAPEAAAGALRAAPNYALWFLAGCLFVIAAIIIIEVIRSKKKRVIS